MYLKQLRYKIQHALHETLHENMERGQIFTHYVNSTVCLWVRRLLAR